jgi:hypothetical protein
MNNNDNELKFQIWACVRCGIVGGFAYHADENGDPLDIKDYEKRKRQAKRASTRHNQICKVGGEKV